MLIQCCYCICVVGQNRRWLSAQAWPQRSSGTFRSTSEPMLPSPAWLKDIRFQKSGPFSYCYSVIIIIIVILSFFFLIQTALSDTHTHTPTHTHTHIHTRPVRPSRLQRWFGRHLTGFPRRHVPGSICDSHGTPFRHAKDGPHK